VCFLIDEIGFVGATSMARIDATLKAVRCSNETWGGLFVVFTGDIFQLPPVQDAPIYEPIYATDKSLVKTG
jgi:hypothetical protein